MFYVCWFSGYNSTAIVQDRFQISNDWSDCKVRGAFDTLQVLDSMYIPTTKGNTTNILEPIACSYPEFGTG
jgi:hypothetical protein